MPKDSNGKRRETTDVERVEVLKLYAEGCTYRKIQAQTGVSKSDVSKIIKRYKETGSLNKVPRPGRPRIIDERAMRRLDRITNNNPYATLAEITADSRLNCAPKTVARALHVLDYHLRVYNVGLWTMDYSAKEYNRGKNVVEDIRNYGL
ncbi:uncharacterized protein H6S33_006921 [Morchella sextelata]|uniref:uncharacterized protein n=1 Tax=Morchella sextelata TaxID=1174677 RepID=UPI001D0382A1|nr:uncharacterized protein H6S33_006921 [Morchella sextelata]KAH0604544.1 hypothetical protein H6S33_006921 [Morchella sextelata]